MTEDKQAINLNSHSFKVYIAEELGVYKAILLDNIYYWYSHNMANNTNKFEDTFWTYNTGEAFSIQFPYIKPRTISKYLKELETDGWILSGNFNKHKYDRTKWYTVTEMAKNLIETPFAYYANGIEQNANALAQDADLYQIQTKYKPNSSSKRENQINSNTTKEQKIYNLIAHEYQKTITKIEYDIIYKWITHYDTDLIEKAIKESVLQNVKKLSYVEAILRDWKANGISTSDKPARKKKNQKESLPSWFNEDIKKEPITEESKKELEELLEAYS